MDTETVTSSPMTGGEGDTLNSFTVNTLPLAV